MLTSERLQSGPGKVFDGLLRSFSARRLGTLTGGFSSRGNLLIVASFLGVWLFSLWQERVGWAVPLLFHAAGTTIVNGMPVRILVGA